MKRSVLYNCAVPNCTSSYMLNSKERHFFRLPKKEPFRTVWSEKMNLERKHNSLRICDLHFETKYFTSTLRQRLITFAIPTILASNKSQVQDEEENHILNNELEEGQPLGEIDDHCINNEQNPECILFITQAEDENVEDKVDKGDYELEKMIPESNDTKEQINSLLHKNGLRIKLKRQRRMLQSQNMLIKHMSREITALRLNVRSLRKRLFIANQIVKKTNKTA